MAKKSPKSTRRTRSKKDATKKASAPKRPSTAMPRELSVAPEETAEQPADQAPSSSQAKQPVEVTAVEAQVQETHEAVEDLVQPRRNRMLANAVALMIVVVALLAVAASMHARRTNQDQSSARAGQDSSKADALLQGGGSVCANGANSTTNMGSADPQSVGMTLQNVPSNSIQTPQGVSMQNDIDTLQAASCF